MLELIDAWDGKRRIPYADLQSQLREASLLHRRKILSFICKNRKKIRPAIESDWLAEQMFSYLLDCVIAGHLTDDSMRLITFIVALRPQGRWLNGSTGMFPKTIPNQKR